MNSSAPNTEQLWQEFTLDLRRFLRSRLPNEAVTEDLLQETYLRVHQKQDTLRDDQSAKAWIYQIARNLIIDFYRSEAKQNLEASEQGRTLWSEPSLPSLTIAEQVSDWLVAEINNLPETYREATHLSAVEGLPQQEIAARLKLSLEATKSRIRRGREQLKSSLAACCSLEKDRRGNVIDYEPHRPGSCCGDGEPCSDSG